MYLLTDLPVRARGLFAAGSPAEVHSVYKSTVNLAVDGALFSLQCAARGRTPLSLCAELSAEELAGLGIQRGDAAFFSADGLTLGSAFFSAEQARFWDPCLAGAFSGCRAWNPKTAAALPGLLRAAAGGGGFGGAALPDYDPGGDRIQQRARGAVDAVCRFAGEADWLSAARESASLIGLGIGLTPSGDDFNCGMLAALFSLGALPAASALRKELIRAVLPAADGTNDISREFLLRACAGEFSQAVRALLECLAGFAPAAALPEAAAALLALGHSSGLDTLNGIVAAHFALSCVSGT